MKKIPMILLFCALLLVAACTQSGTEQRKYVAQGDQCDVVRFFCEENQEYFRDDVGCGCQEKGDTASISDDYQVISTSAEECRAILFACADGFVPYFDENSCGCKKQTVEQIDPAPMPSEASFCTDAEKAAQICTEEYRPVCGWFDSEKIQCLTYPCAQDFGNRCGACANPDVSYVTDGVCPSTNSGNAGGIREVTSSQLLEQIDPQKACTMEYNPVCATFDDGLSVTIGNSCAASNIVGVVSTVVGECSVESEPKRVVMACDASFTERQSADGAICTKEYRPVCASDAAGGQNTYGNVCMACTTPGVFEYTEGSCNEADGAFI